MVASILLRLLVGFAHNAVIKIPVARVNLGR